MTSRERTLAALNHRQPDHIPIDSGSTAVTGIHCSIVEGLRRYYSLENHPVKVHEPYQMLGWIDDDLRECLGLDTACMMPPKTIFGFPNADWRPWTTPWGQRVLVSRDFVTSTSETGDTYIYPEGDIHAPPSGHMPSTGYFFDAIERKDPELDEDNLKLEDNLEEFGPLTSEDIAHWKAEAERVRANGYASVAHLPGTALGDIALVPGINLKHPKGVRGIADWYMLVAEDPDFVMAIFERQTEIALENLKTLYAAIGDTLDVGVICGTDFGTQTSQFCSVDTLRRIWMPYYSRINAWIHEHTPWKTLKHSCGAVEPFIETFIECGFDALNPVQCSATGMDPLHLKQAYGGRITFWGGGVDTQHTLPFGSADEVYREVTQRCEIFGRGGGFVFNSIHNIQAQTPIENVVAMFKAVREFRPVA